MKMFCANIRVFKIQRIMLVPIKRVFVTNIVKTVDLSVFFVS